MKQLQLSKLLKQNKNLLQNQQLRCVNKDIQEIDECDNEFLMATTIYLSNNYIFDTTGMIQFQKCHTLSLAHNDIDSLQDIENLQLMQSLKYLRLDGNPVFQFPTYRQYTINTLPYLISLDGIRISENERLKSKTAHTSERNRFSLLIKEQNRYQQLEQQKALENSMQTLPLNQNISQIVYKKIIAKKLQLGKLASYEDVYIQVSGEIHKQIAKLLNNTESLNIIEQSYQTNNLKNLMKSKFQEQLQNDHYFQTNQSVNQPFEQQKSQIGQYKTQNSQQKLKTVQFQQLGQSFNVNYTKDYDKQNYKLIVKPGGQLIKSKSTPNQLLQNKINQISKIKQPSQYGVQDDNQLYSSSIFIQNQDLLQQSVRVKNQLPNVYQMNQSVTGKQISVGEYSKHGQQLDNFDLLQDKQQHSEEPKNLNINQLSQVPNNKQDLNINKCIKIQTPQQHENKYDAQIYKSLDNTHHDVHQPHQFVKSPNININAKLKSDEIKNINQTEINGFKKENNPSLCSKPEQQQIKPIQTTSALSDERFKEITNQNQYLDQLLNSKITFQPKTNDIQQKSNQDQLEQLKKQIQEQQNQISNLTQVNQKLQNDNQNSILNQQKIANQYEEQIKQFANTSKNNEVIQKLEKYKQKINDQQSASKQNENFIQQLQQNNDQLLIQNQHAQKTISDQTNQINKLLRNNDTTQNEAVILSKQVVKHQNQEKISTIFNKLLKAKIFKKFVQNARYSKFTNYAINKLVNKYNNQKASDYFQQLKWAYKISKIKSNLMKQYNKQIIQTFFRRSLYLLKIRGWRTNDQQVIDQQISDKLRNTLLLQKTIKNLKQCTKSISQSNISYSKLMKNKNKYQILKIFNILIQKNKSINEKQIALNKKVNTKLQQKTLLRIHNIQQVYQNLIANGQNIYIKHYFNLMKQQQTINNKHKYFQQQHSNSQQKIAYKYMYQKHQQIKLFNQFSSMIEQNKNKELQHRVFNTLQHHKQQNLQNILFNHQNSKYVQHTQLYKLLYMHKQLQYNKLNQQYSSDMKDEQSILSTQHQLMSTKIDFQNLEKQYLVLKEELINQRNQKQQIQQKYQTIKSELVKQLYNSKNKSKQLEQYVKEIQQLKLNFIQQFNQMNTEEVENGAGLVQLRQFNAELIERVKMLEAETSAYKQKQNLEVDNNCQIEQLQNQLFKQNIQLNKQLEEKNFNIQNLNDHIQEQQMIINQLQQQNLQFEDNIQLIQKQKYVDETQQKQQLNDYKQHVNQLLEQNKFINEQQQLKKSVQVLQDNCVNFQQQCYNQQKARLQVLDAEDQINAKRKTNGMFVNLQANEQKQQLQQSLQQKVDQKLQQQQQELQQQELIILRKQNEINQQNNKQEKAQPKVEVAQKQEIKRLINEQIVEEQNMTQLIPMQLCVASDSETENMRQKFMYNSFSQQTTQGTQQKQSIKQLINEVHNDQVVQKRVQFKVDQ